MKKINLEKSIATAISKFRKDITGKGPIDCVANIVGHTIYIKINVNLSFTEKTLYQFVIDNHSFQTVMGKYSEGGAKCIDGVLIQENLDVTTKNVILHPDIELEYLYVIVVLNKNLEKELSQ